jgi:hypothetical protein
MDITTQGLALTIPTKLISLINDELSIKIIWTFYFIVYPIVSILGIAANVASTVIISRQGFRKSSNILLVALAVSDILFLVGLNNFTQIIIFISDPQVLQFSETVNYILYIFYIVFTLFYAIGFYYSVLIPVLITGERLLAIITPLTFTTKCDSRTHSFCTILSRNYNYNLVYLQ